MPFIFELRRPSTSGPTCSSPLPRHAIVLFSGCPCLSLARSRNESRPGISAHLCILPSSFVFSSPPSYLLKDLPHTHTPITRLSRSSYLKILVNTFYREFSPLKRLFSLWPFRHTSNPTVSQTVFHARALKCMQALMAATQHMKEG